MKLIPKNWNKFQHYKDRQPPWIKLHKSILDDKEFMRLPIASKALAPLLWLLASESKDGVFDASIDELKFRLRMSEKELKDGLKPLIDNGMFLDASTMLAPCLQVAVTETETETERETDKKVIPVFKKPDDVDNDLWSEWCALRKKQKASISMRVINSIQKEADKAGYTLSKALNTMIVRNWKGFEAEWVNKSAPKTTSRIDDLMRNAI
jgi:hypothetical protein